MHFKMSHTLLKWVDFVQQDTSFQSFYLCSLVLAFILLLLFGLNRAHKKTQLSLPPSPPNKLPILGHLLELGTHPHRNLQILAQKHGPNIMLLHLGHAPTLVVTSAEWAREILKTHDHVFASRPPSYITKKIFYDKDFALAPYGEYWRQMRRICVLQLLSPKRVQSFRSVREQEIALMIDKIKRSSALRPDRVINLSEMLVSLTNDIICRVAFGRKYSEEDVGMNFGEMVKDVVHLMGVFNVGDFIPWLAWVNNFNGMKRKVEKTFRDVDGFLERVVEEHIHDRKEKRADGGGDVADEDLVDVLLGIQNDGSFGDSLGRDNIKAIILDMFLAGIDTSYAVLEWAMGELLMHQKIMKEVQEEVRGVARGKPNVTEDDLDEMHYLKCVIKETLRFHPPAALLLPHESMESIKIQSYDIPAKARVIINAWAIARNPDSWKEPDKFEPKRFMSSSIDYKGQHIEFIPFGTGRRGCPGILFATSTIELALANLLFRYDWMLPNGAKENELDMAESETGVVTHMKSPLLVAAIDHLNTSESTI